MKEIFPIVEKFSVSYTCPKHKKELVVEMVFRNLTAASSYCEPCGEHGMIYVLVSCECGETHEIILKTW